MCCRQNGPGGFDFSSAISRESLGAIARAMDFYQLPEQVRQRVVTRIIAQSAETFNHQLAARRYIELYEKMLRHPLITSQA